MIGLAAAAVVLFRLELFSLVFLIPLQLAWIRHGEFGGLSSSVLVVAATAFIGVVEMSRMDQALSPAVHFVGSSIALAFVIGLFIMNSHSLPRIHGRRLRVCERAGLASLVASVVFGVFFVAAGQALWAEYVALQISRRPELLAQVEASREEIIALSSQALGVLARGTLPGYVALLLGNWWAGSLVAFRTRFPLPEGNPIMEEIAGYTLTRFSVPVNWVWVLIAGWSAVVLVTIADISWLAVVAWNVALGSMVLYAVQGIAVLLFLVGRRGGDQRIRLLLAGGFVLGLLIPGLRVAIAVGIPVLGLSEIWITYHRFEGSEDTDEGHT